MGCHATKSDSQGAVTFHEKYRITAKLGKGAHAQVYQVRPALDYQLFAVKIADLRRYSKSAAPDETDPRKQHTARKEALLLRKVRNEPHIVNLVEAFTDHIFSYIVLELCEMALVEALESVPVLTEKILARFFGQMQQALVAIHKLGIAHCDIKPDNFCCTNADSKVKLCDFGSAEVMPLMGGLKGVRGVAPFTSPEMLNSSRYGTKTDVWSLGVMAYILLYAEFPHHPEVSTAESAKLAIMTGVPEPNFRVKKGLIVGDAQISNSAEHSVRALLARDPKKRPSAKRAGALPWFSQGADGALAASHQSLQPMLHWARHLGIFDVRAVHTKAHSGTLDSTIAALQGHFHGTSLLDCGTDRRAISKSSWSSSEPSWRPSPSLSRNV